MTSRHLFGGSARSALLGVLVLGACAVVPFLTLGCGGDDDDCGPCVPDPRYHNVTIILNTSDLQGFALGLVNVWVDGVLQDERTSWQYVILGDGYPEAWRGFSANWIKAGFTVATYAADDSETISVIVTKPGYYAQGTTFTIDDSQLADVFARETFVMEPTPATASAEPGKVRIKDRPGEVISWSPTTKTSSLPTGFTSVEALFPGPGNVPCATG